MDLALLCLFLVPLRTKEPDKEWRFEELGSIFWNVDYEHRGEGSEVTYFVDFKKMLFLKISYMYTMKDSIIHPDFPTLVSSHISP